jgi:hypothetical protein
MYAKLTNRVFFCRKLVICNAKMFLEPKGTRKEITILIVLKVQTIVQGLHLGIDHCQGIAILL